MVRSAVAEAEDAAREGPAARNPVRLAVAAVRVHWVRSQIVVEVTYLTWTEDDLLLSRSAQGPGNALPTGTP